MTSASSNLLVKLQQTFIELLICIMFLTRHLKFKNNSIFISGSLKVDSLTEETDKIQHRQEVD